MENSLISKLSSLENEEIEIYDFLKIASNIDSIISNNTLLKISKIENLKDILFECFDAYQNISLNSIFTRNLLKTQSVLKSDIAFDYLIANGEV